MFKDYTVPLLSNRPDETKKRYLRQLFQFFPYRKARPFQKKVLNGKRAYPNETWDINEALLEAPNRSLAIKDYHPVCRELLYLCFEKDTIFSCSSKQCMGGYDENRKS